MRSSLMRTAGIEDSKFGNLDFLGDDDGDGLMSERMERDGPECRIGSVLSDRRDGDDRREWLANPRFEIRPLVKWGGSFVVLSFF